MSIKKAPAIKYTPCRDVVRKFSRKYLLNPVYLWDVLGDEFNFIKGVGCLMTQDEIDEFEAIILAG